MSDVFLAAVLVLHDGGGDGGVGLVLKLSTRGVEMVWQMIEY